jgi:hypothetical protein
VPHCDPAVTEQRVIGKPCYDMVMFAEAEKDGRRKQGSLEIGYGCR